SVFNLADNRMLAHATRGGGVVAIGGSPGFAKYLNGGKPNLPWKVGAMVDGKRVALAVDSYARLTLPLAGPARAAYVRIAPPQPRELEVLVAGKKVGHAPVKAGWQTVTVPFDAPVAPGEIELTLVVTKGSAVDWVQLGGSAPPDSAPPLYNQ